VGVHGLSFRYGAGPVGRYARGIDHQVDEQGIGTSTYAKAITRYRTVGVRPAAAAHPGGAEQPGGREPERPDQRKPRQIFHIPPDFVVKDAAAIEILLK
jgi:hypothetical protein